MIKQSTPPRAWKLLKNNPEAVLIDVRTRIEYTHVGHPIGAINIPWKEFPDWTVNPNFVEQVSQSVPTKTVPVLLLCRSGQRSMDAAKALEAFGFTDLTNIEEGFEGTLDAQNHRGTSSGWRFNGLPWEQS